jgi:hypothetical protein
MTSFGQTEANRRNACKSTGLPEGKQRSSLQRPPSWAHGPGDPAQIVAAPNRARMMLGWNPQYDNLATIIAHALAWEQRLQRDVLMDR